MPTRRDWLQFLALLILITEMGFLLLISGLGATHWLWLNFGHLMRDAWLRFWS